jgi:serine/threonine protein kinase/Flp pilus assembly protein TadD
MAAVAADRNLLFGLLALQNGLINQVQLVAAFQAWTLDRARALADHFIALGHLDDTQRAVVEAMADLHVAKHGDIERSLASVSAGRSTRESLAQIGDAQIHATLDRLGAALTNRDQDPDADSDRTASYAVGTATSDGQRFRVLRPHARGGLGAVFVALDEELHREVALKQILHQHADDPTSRQRFLLEAEITGGLEHPGIVPVYGLGTYADGRPYYAMRFIKGDSLKEAIDRFHGEPNRASAGSGRAGAPGRVGAGSGSEQKPRSADATPLALRKLLRRFLDVCNAIDYAHSRGVLHRDIKPGNIIVGQHGETLVVDWGLAKALGRSDPGSGERTLVPSSTSGSAETLPGSALGTPAYMSPEQAAGDLDRLGPRSDVYSLGATLYCLLTGKPPQEGDDIGEVLRKVQRGEFPPPRQLDPSIDAALEAVCLRAMALKPDSRYASCRALAEDVERWMADEPVFAWREPLSRRALRWARRHRPAVTGAAVALLTGLIGAAAATTIYLQQRQAQANRLALALREVNVLRGQAQADSDGDPVKWQAAVQAVKRAEDLLGPLIDAASQRQVRELAEQVASATQTVAGDAALLREAVDIRSAWNDLGDAASDAAYARAFRAAGVDVDALGSESAGAKIKSRPAGVALGMAAALDSWARNRREARPNDTDAWKRLVATARVADPDETRDRLRQLWSQPDPKALHETLLKLAREVDPGTWQPISLTTLARALGDAGEREAAAELLRRAQTEHPGDIWVNYNLAELLEQLHPPRTDEAIRFYSVAQALRPETAHALAHALESRGRRDEAVEVFRDLTERRPADGKHWSCLGSALKNRGDRAGSDAALARAVALLREAVRLTPDNSTADNNLGRALSQQGKLNEAIAEYREAIRLEPDDADVHTNLGVALNDQGELAEAVAAYREAIRLKPDVAHAHTDLGVALNDQGKLAEAIAAHREAIRLRPDSAEAHTNLGLALRHQGKLAEAIAAYREAIRLKPDLLQPHSNLGALWCDVVHDYAAAEAEFREAIRLKPDDAKVHNSLGIALLRKGKLEQAITACREAIRLEPNQAVAFEILGLVREEQGKLDEAIAAYHEAIRLKPDDPEAYCNLADVLRKRGNYRESLAEYRRGHELGSKRSDWAYPSAEWVRQAERLVALDSRLPAILRGDDTPNDAADLIAVADLARKMKRLSASVRLYAESFRADPKLAEDMKSLHRYNAACSAALLVAGKGDDKPLLDEPAKARCRKQALEWLRADLSYWTKQAVTGKPETTVLIVETLQHWKEDSDLAGIRDETALAALPEDERKAFRALWAEVDARLAKARAGPASRPQK